MFQTFPSLCCLGFTSSGDNVSVFRRYLHYVEIITCIALGTFYQWILILCEILFLLVFVTAIDTRVNEETGSSRTGLKELSQWNQFKVPGLHTSMSMSDLVTHIGNCISEHMTSGSPLLSAEGWQGKDILDEITQHLLGDSQFSSISDEHSLMLRVNSLCCLLQKETPTDQHSQVKTEACLGSEDGSRSQVNATPESTQEKLGDFSASGGGPSDVSGCRQPPAMSRKDSLGDLLLHLPRIASLPQFLFNISEDFESQAR